jgi:hypothetical protein
MCAFEPQKLRHDRTEPYTRALQPALWLLISTPHHLASDFAALLGRLAR